MNSTEYVDQKIEELKSGRRWNGMDHYWRGVHHSVGG